MIKVLTVGNLAENCIIVIDELTKECAIVDPGAEGEKILKTVEGLNPVAIINTHGHIDHTGQVGYIKNRLNIPFYMNKKDEFLLNDELFTGLSFILNAVECPPPDFDLKEGDEIKIGNILLNVIETPGHTPGSVCFFDEKNKILISGDILFRDSIGRTDLPGGNSKQMELSLQKLMNLPEDTVVYPGHGEKTTIGREKKYNPFITGRFKLKWLE